MAPRIYYFYAEDVDSLRIFFRMRLSTLPVAILQRMAINWILYVQPDLEEKCGPFDDQLPDQRYAKLPSWWPTRVRYMDPLFSHGGEGIYIHPRFRCVAKLCKPLSASVKKFYSNIDSQLGNIIISN